MSARWEDCGAIMSSPGLDRDGLLVFADDLMQHGNPPERVHGAQMAALLGVGATPGSVRLRWALWKLNRHPRAGRLRLGVASRSLDRLRLDIAIGDLARAAAVISAAVSVPLRDLCESARVALSGVDERARELLGRGPGHHLVMADAHEVMADAFGALADAQESDPPEEPPVRRQQRFPRPSSVRMSSQVPRRTPRRRGIVRRA